MAVISIKGIVEQLDILIKDIPMDHIVKGVQAIDRPAYFRYFKGYRIQKLGRKRIREIVEREILDKDNEKLAELFMALWNRANDNLYHEMLHHVKQINEDVEAIKHIEDEDAEKIVERMLEEYDQERIFICVVLNQVRFSPAFVLKTFGYPLPERPEEEEADESAKQGDAPAGEAPTEAAPAEAAAPETSAA